MPQAQSARGFNNGQTVYTVGQSDNGIPTLKEGTVVDRVSQGEGQPAKWWVRGIYGKAGTADILETDLFHDRNFALLALKLRIADKISALATALAAAN
jgi:hypothetical protein